MNNSSSFSENAIHLISLQNIDTPHLYLTPGKALRRLMMMMKTQTQQRESCR